MDLFSPSSGSLQRGTVTVACQVFHPDAQSTGQLLSEVLAQLAAAGQGLEIWSGFPGVYDGPPLPAREWWRGVRIVRIGWRGSVKQSMALRLLTYASYSAGIAWRLLVGRRRRILAVTNPPFLPVVVWLVSVCRGHRVKLMLQDIYPDGLTAVGRLRDGGLVDRLWRVLNRRAFCAAAEVWVLGRDMAELVARRYSVPAERIRVVPLWSPVEFDPPPPAEQTQLCRQLRLEKKFIVQYSGNMGLWHDLEMIVRAAADLQRRTDIHFLFIGSGCRRAEAEVLSQRLGLRNVTWLPYQPIATLADSLACCHVALVSQRAGLEGVAVPCKLYGILASGRAVVAQVPAESEVARVINEEACGRVVPPGDASALAACLTALADDRAEARREGDNARAAYLGRYTRVHAVRAFAEGFATWSCTTPRQTRM